MKFSESPGLIGLIDTVRERTFPEFSSYINVNCNWSLASTGGTHYLRRGVAARKRLCGYYGFYFNTELQELRTEGKMRLVFMTCRFCGI